MALRKEPSRRYPGVGSLADDVHRHLESFPVRARKDTASYRTGKFIQRHRLGVAAASFIALAVLGGLGATAWQAHVARAERAKAEQRFNEVRELAHSVLFEYHDRIAALPGATQVRQLLVTDALKYLNNLSREAGDDQGLLREVATAYEKVGQIQGNSYYNNLGDTDGAMKSYRESLTIRERLLAANPTNLEIQHELANSHHGLGDMFYSVGDLRAGLASYERAREIREKVIASDKGNVNYRLALAELYSRIGDIKGMEGYANLGDVAGALASYRKAEALLEPTLAADPSNREIKSTVGEVLSHVALLADTSGDIDSALDKGRRAVNLLQELVGAEPNNHSYHLQLLATNACLRYALIDSNQLSESIEHSKANIIDLRAMAATDPKDVQIRRDLGVSYNALGMDLLAIGDVNGALKSHAEALSIAESILASDPTSAEDKSDLAFTVQRLGEAQAAAGDHRAALDNYRRAFSLREPSLAADPSNARVKQDLSGVYADLANALAATGDPTLAEEHFNKAISLAEELAAAAPANVKLHAGLALRYLEGGNFHQHQAEGAQSTSVAKSQWQIARTYFSRSLDLWADLRKQGTLLPNDANRPAEVEQAIVKCDAALNQPALIRSQ
jgi:tetratricopeptide (TPR) repeat protein